MQLILNDLTPLHWAAGGAAIAAVTLALLFVANRRLGISGGFDDLCSLALSSPYFRRGAVRVARPWPFPFLAGLVIAGFLAVPLLNLVTPLFAAAMMVHLHKMLSEPGRRDGPAAVPGPR